jgi:hypothetical protein
MSALRGSLGRLARLARGPRAPSRPGARDPARRRGPFCRALVTSLLATGCGALLGIDDVEPLDVSTGGAAGVDASGMSAGTGPGAGGRSGNGRAGGAPGGRAGGDPGGRAGGDPGGRAGGDSGDGAAGAGGAPTSCALEPSDQNDRPDSPGELDEFFDGCDAGSVTSVLRAGDTDWFTLTYSHDFECLPAAIATFSAAGVEAGAVEVCVFARPLDSTAVVSFTCPLGQTPSDAAGPDFRGCCGPGRGRLFFEGDETLDDLSAEVLFRVSGLAGGSPCVSYDLDFELHLHVAVARLARSLAPGGGPNAPGGAGGGPTTAPGRRRQGRWRSAGVSGATRRPVRAPRAAAANRTIR